MTPPKAAKSPKIAESRISVINTVTTPLGFFVLVVLVIEALVGVLAISMPSEHRIEVLRYMLYLAVGLVATVSLTAYFNPEALYGKRFMPEIAVDRVPEITADEAIAKAERFAHLIGALIVIKTMYGGRRGLSVFTGGADEVMTDLRKRMYGYRAIFGSEKVIGTAENLSELIGDVLNSKETLDAVMQFVVVYLLHAERGILDRHGNVRPEQARVDKESEVDLDYGDGETEVDVHAEMERRFARARRIERALSEEGSESLYNKVVNVLWRNFESAILSRALPPDAADTFLETIRGTSECMRRQTEGSKQADSSVRNS
jgi:hypothetical protein